MSQKLSKRTQARLARLINSIECGYLMSVSRHQTEAAQYLALAGIDDDTIALSDEFGIDLPCVDEMRLRPNYWRTMAAASAAK